MAQASDQGQILGTTIVTIPGHIGSGFEGSSTSGCRTEGPVPFNIVHSTVGEQEPTSFQAEDIEQICPHRKVQTRKFGPTKKMLKPNDFLMKLDLKDAYYSVPVAVEYRKYLRFHFQDATYELQCLPFGLSSAPRAFTKLVKPVIAILRISGIRVVIYLDDLLLFHQDPIELQTIFKIVITLLTDLGFIIKLEKCSPSPTQAIIFLGAQLNSTDMTIAVPLEKLRLIQSECKEILTRGWCSMLELSALLGRMNQTARIGIWEAPLHCRALQRMFIAAIHRKGHFT